MTSRMYSLSSFTGRTDRAFYMDIKSNIDCRRMQPTFMYDAPNIIIAPKPRSQELEHTIFFLAFENFEMFNGVFRL